MKAVSSLALLLSIGALSLAAYTYQYSAKLSEGIGDYAYAGFDPALNIKTEDMKVEFGSYSNKLSGKIKIKVTNDSFPLDDFLAVINISVRNSQGAVLAKTYIRHEVEGKAVTLEFKDEYLLDDDSLKVGTDYSFVVDDYAWSPKQTKYKSVE